MLTPIDVEDQIRRGFFSGRGAIFRGLDTPLGIAQIHSAVCQRWVSFSYANSSLVASTMSSSTSTSRPTSTSTGGPSTSTSTKYNCTKLHNLEHFTKILGFTEMHRVKVKHTQQLGLVLDIT